MDGQLLINKYVFLACCVWVRMTLVAGEQCADTATNLWFCECDNDKSASHVAFVFSSSQMFASSQRCDIVFIIDKHVVNQRYALDACAQPNAAHCNDDKETKKEVKYISSSNWTVVYNNTHASLLLFQTGFPKHFTDPAFNWIGSVSQAFLKINK